MDSSFINNKEYNIYSKKNDLNNSNTYLNNKNNFREDTLDFFGDNSQVKHFIKNRNDSGIYTEKINLPDDTMNTEFIPCKTNLSKGPDNIQLKFEVLKIQNIFNLNIKKKIPRELGLWYLINTNKNMYGPLSSQQIYDLYNNRLLDGNWQARLIDIFKFKDSDIYEFKNLSFINNNNWADKVTDSSLIIYSDMGKSYYSSEIKNNNLINNSLELTYIKVEETLPLENLTILETLNKVNKKENLNIKDDKILTNIDEEEWTEVNKKKKKNKKIDESIYLVGIQKNTEEIEVKPKYTTKINIVPADELLNCLKPKKNCKKGFEKEIKTCKMC